MKHNEILLYQHHSHTAFNECYIGHYRALQSIQTARTRYAHTHTHAQRHTKLCTQIKGTNILRIMATVLLLLLHFLTIRTRFCLLAHLCDEFNKKKCLCRKYKKCEKKNAILKSNRRNHFSCKQTGLRQLSGHDAFLHTRTRNQYTYSTHTLTRAPIFFSPFIVLQLLL